MMREREFHAPSGLGMLVILLLALVGSLVGAITTLKALNPAVGVPLLLLALFCLFCLFGCFIVNPNEGRVLQMFGDYRGTAKQAGLRWANPFYSKRRISLRVRNFETAKLKVNDQRGNPIEIGCVIVWKVIDTAEAVFHVDNYENYVAVQSEAALRNLATRYPYDAHGDEVDMVSHTAEISLRLKDEVAERLAQAGVDVVDTRISHLAYAPEIASAMLQRQQATAVVAARQKIVEGAVGMVEMALDMLATKGVVELDEERKAAMVSNLLVVLCSDRHTQPVINTGTLHN